MSRPQPARLGPFTGGINTASDPSMLQDNEMVDCTNMSLDLDGSLVARPPIKPVTPVAVVLPYTDFAVIGNGIIDGIPYVFYSYYDDTLLHTTMAFDGVNTLFIAAMRATVALQYGDVVYFVPGTNPSISEPNNGGGYWDGFTFTAFGSGSSAIPPGESAVFYKSRLWVTPGDNASALARHQLKFTEPIDPNAPGTLDWNAGVNLIPVSPGDGEYLMDIKVYNDNLILFKQDSTYIFVYDVLPTQGTLKLINDNIGVSSRRCVVSYENSLYTMHEGKVYEIVNYNFARINEKTPFILETDVPVAGQTLQFPVCMSLFGDKLIVRYYKRTYVYELRTKTWSRWIMQDAYSNYFGPLVDMPQIAPNSFNIQYYAASALSTNHLFVIKNGYDNATYEVASVDGTTKVAIICTVYTKTYDFGESFNFKRLTWWGMDCITQSNCVGYAFPVAVRPIATWGVVDDYTWGQIQNSIWAYPVPIGIGAISTSVTDPNLFQRKFIKFLKALRFRQIYFGTLFYYYGSTNDGPPRFVSLTAFVGSKQLVPKQVN